MRLAEAPRWVLRSASLRLAALYTATFAAAVALLGVLAIFVAHAVLANQFDNRIKSDLSALTQKFQTGGIQSVEASVREHTERAGTLDFGVQTPTGGPIVGVLATAPARPGWSIVNNGAGRENGFDRILLTILPNGYRVLVGDNINHVGAVDSVVIPSFGAAFLAVVLLGAGLGYSLNLRVHRQIAVIGGTAQGIIEGDMSRRVPITGDDDELDRLAITLNRMLDRIASLLETLSQVSNDIAHDLRTPLTRLRQRLEASLATDNVERRAEAVTAGLADLDGIMGIFAALLRIAEIESGVRHLGLRAFDLVAQAENVVEAFAPSAEDAGGSLILEGDGAMMIEGDPELATQMIVNLVENALRHAGAGARIVVRCEQRGATPLLLVTDDGPGIPAAEREQVFDRFHRLEASRSTPGSGLGLALVAAVAKLHGARVSLHDAAPGLRVKVTFANPSKAPPV